MNRSPEVLGADLELLEGLAVPEPAGRLPSQDGGDHGAAEGGAPRLRPDLAILPVWADVRPLQGMAGMLDWRWGGRLSALLRRGMYTGRAGERLLMPGGPGMMADRLVLVGLGPHGEFGEAQARPSAQGLVALATSVRARDVLLALPQAGDESDADERLLAAVVERLREPALATPEDVAACEAPAAEGSARTPSTQPEALRERAVPWWICVSPETVGRMRRMIEGPLRPAPPG